MKIPSSYRLAALGGLLACLLSSCAGIPVARTYTLETPLGRASVRFEPPASQTTK